MEGSLEDEVNLLWANFSGMWGGFVNVNMISVEVDAEGNYLQVNEDGSKTRMEKAKITLNDCLACSGCITSAEAVLVSSQGVEEFLRVLEEERQHRLVVISVSPQSRSSLACYFHISVEECFGRLVTLFKQLGADVVCDTTWSRDISLLEGRHEFLERKASGGPLPVLTSVCPGWVCYAEKSHGKLTVPLMSNVKSPQAVMGTLIKRHCAEKRGLRPSEVLHVAIMPCFDKKLEASRSELTEPAEDSRETDLVLSSGEILELLEKKQIDFLSLDLCPAADLADLPFTSVTADGRLLGSRWRGSGGYAEDIMQFAARELFGVEDFVPEFHPLRNKDVQEASLVVDGKCVLKFALMYGFRNIQNLIRRVKQGRCDYDYVEVMACPSGCLNGGGQIRPEAPETPRELLERLEHSYREPNPCDPEDNCGVQELYASWVGGTLGSREAMALFHTSYHSLEKPADAPVNPVTLRW